MTIQDEAVSFILIFLLQLRSSGDAANLLI